MEYLQEQLATVPPEERHRRFRDDPRLREILPEVYSLQGVPQPPDHHPEGDALNHTLLAVKAIPPDGDPRLALAALLHDIGKKKTTREVDGRIRAFGHDRAGAEMAEALLERLGLPGAQREDVVWLIRHHMFALSWQIFDLKHLSRLQWRLIRDARFPLLLDLMEIDARAAGGHPDKLAQVSLYRTARAISDRHADPTPIK